MIWYFFILIIIAINVIFSVLVSVAFMTLLERKVIGSVQNRRGPNVTFFGFLQPIADAVKLILKEYIFPRSARLGIFVVSPVISMIFAFIGWSVMPVSSSVVISNINLTILFLFSISILHVYSIVLAGWSSNSRYSFLGGMRSSAQLLSYDVALGVTIMALSMFTKTLNISEIVYIQKNVGWFIFYFPILFLIFFVCALAETNRHPFDLPEAESELVGGYTTEYSSVSFAFFFLAEYSAMLLMSVLIVNLFLGGWEIPSYLKAVYIVGSSEQFCFAIKVIIIYYIFLIIRAGLPRYRYDQLMRLGWKYLLPISLSLYFYYFVIELTINYIRV